MSDPDAIALIGPLRSRDVAECAEVTAPAGLPLLAPLATWAGVTRHDEPGCEDAARGDGTVLRLLARDTVVAARVAGWLGEQGRRAWVVASEGEYGRQLDGQLLLAGLDRAERPDVADVAILAGVTVEAGLDRLAEVPPGIGIIAFDGAQGADVGGRPISFALPTGPAEGLSDADALVGLGHARRAASLVREALHTGAAADRASMLEALRAAGPFDAHGDPVDPAVWLWRADAAWALTPERAI